MKKNTKYPFKLQYQKAENVKIDVKQTKDQNQDVRNTYIQPKQNGS